MMSMYRTPSFGSVTSSRERFGGGGIAGSRRDSDSRVVTESMTSNSSSHLPKYDGHTPSATSRIRPVSSTGQLDRSIAAGGGSAPPRMRDTSGGGAGGTYIPLSQRTGGYTRPASRALLRSMSASSSGGDEPLSPATTINNGDITSTVSRLFKRAHAHASQDSAVVRNSFCDGMFC